MKHLIYYFCFFILLLNSCSDDTTSPTQTETVVYSLDSLVVYSGDTLYLCSGSSSQTTYTGNTNWKLSLNANTNDSSSFSILAFRIFSSLSNFTNQQTNLEVTKSGSSINLNYSENINISRNDNYLVRVSLCPAFDTSYHTSGKFIKIHNVKFSKIN